MRLIDIAYFLFIVSASLDPTGYHTRLKDVMFVILVVYGLLYCMKRRPYLAAINRVTVISFLLLPVWGMFIAYISGNLTAAPYATGQIRSMFYVLIFFFLVTMRVDILLKIVWINGIILSVVTLVMFILAQSDPILMEIIYDYCVTSNNFLMAANRNFLGFAVNGLWMRGGSLIIFAFVYNLYQYDGPFKTVLSVILFLALFFAGSRTPMLVQTLILLVYLYDKNVIGKFFTRLSALMVLFGFVTLVFLLATQENEDSNELKYENFYSYVDDICEGGHAIWGAGVGSEFYAKGRDEKLPYSELSYMDIIRMYGFPVGLCFIFLFFAPYFWLWRFFPKSLFLNRYALGYVLFLILSGTNPLLLGSIGLTGLTLFMVLVNKTSDLSEEERERSELVIDGYLLK